MTGVSKEKNQATEEFEEAVSAGKFAGKVDFVTDDSMYQSSLNIH